MRCLSLAGSLKEKGAEVSFICREHQGNMCEFIQEQGFSVTRLLAPAEGFRVEATPMHADWLGVTWQEDAAEVSAVIESNPKPDWLVVDHYSIDHRWEQTLRPLVASIMVVDDLADRIHDCDLVLDQNYFENPEKRYAGLVPEDCTKLLGPKYALLRPEFRTARAFSKIRGGGIGRILVYFGGSDPHNLTGMCLEALSCSKLKHLLVDVVVGYHNPYLEKLHKQVKVRPNSRLYVQPSGFVEMMLRADLFVGAGGSTSWERLCLNLPSVVITTGIDEIPLTLELSELGFVSWIGRAEDASEKKIWAAVLSEISRSHDKSPSPDSIFVDGLGALRVAEALFPSLEQELSLRPARISDAATYSSWANDPITRKQSFDQQLILWENHETWFDKKIRSDASYIWVMKTPERLPVGQIRFDVNNDIADIDYSLDPLVRGRGWGKKLLSEGINAFKDHCEGKPVRGRVKEDNLLSCRVFQRLGFVDKGVKRGGRIFHWL